MEWMGEFGDVSAGFKSPEATARVGFTPDALADASGGFV
jgi:hypothetical protein